MLEDAISIVSFLAYSLSTWFTPKVLFLLLNLVIFTIAFTSGFATNKRPTNHYHHQPPLQTQLTRTPSILQRFKSINFYGYIPNNNNNVTHYNLANAESQNINYYYEQTPSIPDDQLPHHVPPQTTTTLPAAKPDPVPPVEDPPPPPPPEVVEEEIGGEGEGEGLSMDEIYRMITQNKGNSGPHYGRQNSDTKTSGGEVPVKLPRKIMKKSASDKSAFNHLGGAGTRQQFTPAVAEEEEEVDARADDFISKFRRDLRKERLDSTQRY